MSWSRRSVILGAAAGLAGCGFTPLYKQDGTRDAVPQFAQIAVAQPDDRLGQQFRNTLLDILTPRGTPERPLWLLEYKITETQGSVFVSRRDEITRNNLNLSVSATLRDYRSGTAYFSTSTSSQASYNLTVADFSNLVSEKNARERALRDAAEQIRLRLGAYFERVKTQPVKPS